MVSGRFRRLVGLCLFSFLAMGFPAYSSDPVDAFIAAADSISGIPDSQGLEALVRNNPLLVGTAAGRLAETAVELRTRGEAALATEHFELARRIASIHEELTSSDAVLRLVCSYMDWDARSDGLWLEAKALEDQANEARDAGEFDRAIVLLEQAVQLYDSIGDKRAVAVLWGSLGVVCWYKADFEAVAGHYARALDARRAIGDHILIGKTLNGLGSVNYQLGNLDLALDYYRQAADLRQRTGDISGLATSLTYLGNVYLAQGRVLEARLALEEALPVVENTGDRVKQFELLTSLAGLNADMGRTVGYTQALRDALDLAIKMDDPRRQAICRNNLALGLAEEFRYREALREIEATGELLRLRPDPEQTVVYYRNRGIINMRVGELEWAESDFDSLLVLSESLQMPVFQIEALLNLGYLNRERGDFDDGLIYATDASDLAGEVGNRRLRREATVLAAELEHNLGRYEDALAAWRGMLEQDRGAGTAANIAVDLMGIANNLVLSGRIGEARRALWEAGPLVETVGKGDLTLAHAFALGHSFEKTDPESAWLFYSRALDLIDRTRIEIGASDVRTGYLGGCRRFYFEEVAGYCAGLARGRDADVWSSRAFRTIERAKARGLLDVVESSVLAGGSPEEEALIDSLYALDPDGPGYDENRRRLEEDYHHIRSLRLWEAGWTESAVSAVAGPSEVQEAIPGGTAMLAYALGDTASLLWVVDAAGSDVHRLPARAILEKETAALREAISQPVFGDQDLRRTARSLFRALLDPASERIASAGRLVIVPDGVLFELPFEVLLSGDAVPGTGWDDMPYLARSHEVIYAPSASLYLAMSRRGGRDDYQSELLALGDPEYSGSGDAGDSALRLDRLPHSRDEVLGIAALLEEERKDVYLGAAARESALKRRLRAGSVRVLHLAAHGTVDPTEPTASGIALCPDPDGPDDGYLQMLEVMSLPADVGLVVLSACDSGRGRIGRGEGVIGLGRAFMAAGAGGVVASLWAVSDVSTADLMHEFYRALFRERMPAGAAMNRARLALIENIRYSHPFYWSPFVVMAPADSPW